MPVRSSRARGRIAVRESGHGGQQDLRALDHSPPLHRFAQREGRKCRREGARHETTGARDRGRRIPAGGRECRDRREKDHRHRQGLGYGETPFPALHRIDGATPGSPRDAPAPAPPSHARGSPERADEAPRTSGRPVRLRAPASRPISMRSRRRWALRAAPASRTRPRASPECQSTTSTYKKGSTTRPARRAETSSAAPRTRPSRESSSPARPCKAAISGSAGDEAASEPSSTAVRMRGDDPGADADDQPVEADGKNRRRQRDRHDSRGSPPRRGFRRRVREALKITSGPEAISRGRGIAIRRKVAASSATSSARKATSVATRISSRPNTSATALRRQKQKAQKVPPGAGSPGQAQWIALHEVSQDLG